MFSYVSLGSNDIARSRIFWDAALAALGIGRLADHDTETSSSWGAEAEGPLLWLTAPYDGKPATAGNGTMVSFRAATRAAVDAFHAAALGNGGRCEGPPGLRPHYGPTFYAAYVRDPDGNKACAVCYAAM